MKNGTITYASKLERASWNSKKHHASSGPLEILRYIDDDAPNSAATLSTARRRSRGRNAVEPLKS